MEAADVRMETSPEIAGAELEAMRQAIEEGLEALPELNEAELEAMRQAAEWLHAAAQALENACTREAVKEARELVRIAWDVLADAGLEEEA